MIENQPSLQNVQAIKYHFQVPNSLIQSQSSLDVKLITYLAQMVEVLFKVNVSHRFERR